MIATRAPPPERELAVPQGISRPSARETIRGLAMPGVDRTRQAGAAGISELAGGTSIGELDAGLILGPIRFLLSLGESNVQNLCDARRRIESDVARRAAENMVPAALNRLDKIRAAEADAIDDPIAFRQSDLTSHEALREGSGTAYLKRPGKGLKGIRLEFRKKAFETRGVVGQSRKDQSALVKVTRSRDPAAARAAARHMRSAYQSTVAQGAIRKEES